jgi:hypothetical protein
MKEIILNNQTYVLKDDTNFSDNNIPTKELRYVIVRTRTAGVHAGYLYHREGKEVVLKKSRNIWKWAGASTLSQLAMTGTSNPSGCKFPCVVDHIELTDAIEILHCTEEAKKCLETVPVWSC